jgi:hypothetical protein
MSQEHIGDGGFNNSSPGAPPGGASSGGKAGKGNKQRMSTCTSVTLKQLNFANIGGNDLFQIDGKDITNARIVGRLVSLDQSMSDKIVLTVSDGTHKPINVNVYRFDSLFFLDKLAEISSGNPLIELIVHVKPAGGISMDLSTTGPENFRVIKDGNGLTHHILDCINTHLMNTRGPLPRTGSNAGYSSSSAQAMYAAQLSLEGGSSGSGSNNAVNELVFDAFTRHINKTDNDGRASDVYQILQEDAATKHITMANIEKACEELMYEGRIYSTVDDMTFRTTS